MALSNLGSGAGKGAVEGSFLGMPGAVAGAAIGGITSLVGGKKGSDASKDAAKIQAKVAREALAEQRRIFDIARADEERDYQRLINSRRNAFGQDYTPQNNILPQYGGRGAQALPGAEPTAPSSNRLPPQFGRDIPQNSPQVEALLSTPAPGTPQMPFDSPTLRSWFPQVGESMVWLKAPTGEVQQVPLSVAPMLQQKGAVIVPGPMGG